MTDTADEAPAVAVSGLRKEYEAAEETVVAVDGVSFEIPQGEVVAILGPNGAGKTTIVKSILNLVTPTAGEVSVLGDDPRESPETVYRRVSTVLEGARNCYWQLTLRDNLHFFAGVHGRGLDDDGVSFDRLVSSLELADRVDDPIRDYSRGMKQKAAFATALVQDPDVLFLDEPTLGLDVSARETVRSFVGELATEGRTIVVSSHNMEFVRAVCDRMIVIADGEIAADDDIESLIGEYAADAYELTVTGTLSEADRQTLRDRFDAESFESVAAPAAPGDEGRERFEATVADEAAFYDLIDALESAGVTVADVDSFDGDLERTFIQTLETHDTGSSATERPVEVDG